MSTELSPGALIGRRYRLDTLLGEGGMGAVWAATHVVTRQHVAAENVRRVARLSDKIIGADSGVKHVPRARSSTRTSFASTTYSSSRMTPSSW